METEEIWNQYGISDYHRLKYLGDDINEVLTIVLKNIKAGIGLFEVGETVRALYLNESFFECIGYTAEEYEQNLNNIFSTLHKDDIEEFQNCILEHAGKLEPIYDTVRGYRQNGNLGVFDIKGAPIENKISDSPIYLTVVSDVTDTMEKEQRIMELNRLNSQLSIQQERYKILEATARGLLFEYDPHQDTMVFSYNFPNNKKRKVIEHYKEYSRKSPLVHSNHIEAFRKALRDACRQEQEGDLEYLSTVSGGGYRWHLTHYKSMADAEGNILSVIGRIEDIHDEKMKREQLNRKADVDGLTNLYRKEVAFEKMQEFVTEAPELEFYFIVMDLDDFKQINDRYGHQYGDKILKKTAEVLIRLFGESSIIGRFGGDEFVILTKGMAYEEVNRLLDALREEVKFCAGIVAWRKEEDVRSTFDRADKAMYQVKAGKKNGSCFEA